MSDETNFGPNVKAAIYVRDAVIEFSRKAMLSERDARTILTVRDRMMSYASRLDEAEARIIELEAALATPTPTPTPTGA